MLLKIVSNLFILKAMFHHKYMCKVRNAFTLLELVLVISIVSVLASLVIFNLRPADIFQNTNRVKKAANAVETILGLQLLSLSNERQCVLCRTG